MKTRIFALAASLIYLSACAGKSSLNNDSVGQVGDTGSPGGTETGCDGVDADRDGVSACEDCDDSDADIRPGVEDGCDSVDNDCDGQTDEDGVDSTWYTDADGDGYGEPGTEAAGCEASAGAADNALDCDDGDGSAYPDALETCDGVDNDCDGQTDEDAVDADTWYEDADGDGFGNAEGAVTSCDEPTGRVDQAGDCDDSDGASFPGNDEVCDFLDNDCDGESDEGDALGATDWYTDADGDGWGDLSTRTVACEGSGDEVAVSGDCDDGDDAVSPDALEVCDGLDNDCDDLIDDDDEAADATDWYTDADEDGYGDGAGELACTAPIGTVADATDCDDSDSDINPGTVERCDGVDDDCDGSVDEGFDDDGDGIANCFELSYDLDWLITVDDAETVYIDGVSAGTGSGWSSTETFSATLDSGDHVLAVYGVDTGKSIAGMISAVYIDGVADVLTGDGDWLVTQKTPSSTWTDLSYDDSAWDVEKDCKSSDITSYWGTTPTDLTGAGATWIWGGKCTDYKTTWFRLSFSLP